MNEQDPERLAAEYALGVLDADLHERVAARLDGNAMLRGLVEDWERRLAPLAAALPPVPPPPGLWSAIEAAVDAEEAPAVPGAVDIFAGRGEWRSLVPGIEVKQLSVDRAEGMQSYLLRFAPGARLPAHPHRRDEECIVLEGEMRIGSRRFAPGDYHRVPAGVAHPAISSPGGGVVFIRGELREGR